METTLNIQNDYSCLQTDNKKLLNTLWEKLRFRERNCYFNNRYRRKIWDGYVDFFSKKTGKFLTGLLPEIKLVLKYFDINYKEIDNRIKLNIPIKEIDCNFLNSEENITLEDYQVDFINLGIKYQRGLIKSPTASGKTYLLISLMKCLPSDIPILFLGNRKTIIQQNYKEMLKWGFDNVGKFDGSTHDLKQITCATVQSAHHLEPVLDKFQALFVDEVHMMMSNKCIKLYKKLKNCNFRIGLSATPFKHGEADKVHKYNSKGYFGAVFKTKTTESGLLTTEYLQEKGRLSSSICTFNYVKEPNIPYDIYTDAVTNGIAQNFTFHNLVKKIVSDLKGRTLIIVDRIAHGDALKELMPNSLWIQGKDNNETRDKVINQLKNSKDDVVAIATSGIFNVGVNVFVHNLINAAGGKADHDIIQRMGRGLRPADDKSVLNYYDFIFTINPYLEKHSKERIRVLTKEKHKIIINK